ncbi:olfactory receptor 10T2-like [Pygocentrus nattereri]|uniref:olfactory receptor 10T2-like n=1 Tax=Pygocentrus nattereri TaxID=42514 RepID=UPI0008145D36|nr:olfactory receptor 10T2-like [Pygocentrus nattereri]
MNMTEPVTFFIIEGLKDKYMILFPIFLTIYVLVLGGNSMIIYLVRTDPKLNSPMYFFLHHLSFCDMIYTSSSIPNMLSGFLVDVKTISKMGCFAQMYIFLSMTVVGRGLLTVMAFDRYLAICHPLRYTSIMTRRIRYLLIFLAWLFGWFIPFPALIIALPLPFCGPNIVKHIFCDHTSVVRLACTDTTRNNIVSLTFALFAIISTFLLILASYICIGKAISKMGSAERLKAAATCVSHLIVVCISYVSASCVYISYRVATFDPDVRLIIAVLYSVLTPLLNPFIYSLRNKELKDALKRAFCRYSAASHAVRKTVPSISS